MSAEQRIKSLGLQLPTGSGPAGNYATAVQSGHLLFLSGKAPLPVDGVSPRGRVGSDYSTAQGRELARSACMDLLATIRHALGSLDRVERIVEMHGAICTAADFEDHAKVLDGASDLLVEIFGEAGLHTRSAIGVLSLRGGIPLTLRATVEVKQQQTAIPPMLSPIFVGVSDFERALAFYQPLMAALGVQARFCDASRPWAGWQSHPGLRPLFVIARPHDGQAHQAGNGQMVAFLAGNRAAVRDAYAAALAHGGTCEGAPGLRPEYHEHYYGAYFRDPDGNKLCVACHAPD